MNRKKIFILGLAFIFISISYAGNQDSVMTVPGIYAVPGNIYYSSVISGVVIGSNISTEKETDLCPAGMTGPTGGATYAELEAALRLKGFKIVNMTNPYASDNWFGLFSAGLCKIL